MSVFDLPRGTRVPYALNMRHYSFIGVVPFDREVNILMLQHVDIRHILEHVPVCTRGCMVVAVCGEQNVLATTDEEWADMIFKGWQRSAFGEDGWYGVARAEKTEIGENLLSINAPGVKPDSLIFWNEIVNPVDHGAMLIQVAARLSRMRQISADSERSYYWVVRELDKISK